MIGGIGTVGGAIAIVLAASLGRSAIKDFRHQKVIERQIAQAESALTAAYQLKSAISEIRSAATWGYESEESRAELSEHHWFKILPKDKQDRHVQSNVFYMRIRQREDVFDKAFSILPFVKAFFGAESEAAILTILRCGRSVRVYADAYARDAGSDPAFSRKIEGIIWEGAVDPEDDATSLEIDQAMKRLEITLLPMIRLTN